MPFGVEDERGIAFQDDEDLLLLALRLVVLLDPVLRLELDEVQPERAHPE